MWSYSNPVKIQFGIGALDRIGELIADRPYCLVTYNDPVFDQLSERIQRQAGEPALVINDIQPNPDFAQLVGSCERFKQATTTPAVIVALGGGSVMDAAKVLAVANGDFGLVRHYLETQQGGEQLSALPIIAIPTTAGTGSEVTCWATVWHAAANKKYSLAHPDLYADCALVDPALTQGLPLGLTISTGLDALSHALESIWNHNSNPVSASMAVTAAKGILSHLPALASDLDNLELRAEVSKAALLAGMAFSNTKTALAHNISYPITLRYGVPHGLACSFTLPHIMRTIIGQRAECDRALSAIFGDCLDSGAERFEALFKGLGVSTNPYDYGVKQDEWLEIVDLAFAGERGRNFIGTKEQFLKVS